MCIDFILQFTDLKFQLIASLVRKQLALKIFFSEREREGKKLLDCGRAYEFFMIV
jgi:hypothetical protein